MNLLMIGGPINAAKPSKNEIIPKAFAILFVPNISTKTTCVKHILAPVISRGKNNEQWKQNNNQNIINGPDIFKTIDEKPGIWYNEK